MCCDPSSLCAVRDGSLLPLFESSTLQSFLQGSSCLVQELPCLEVLDLHSNLMETMDGISTLVSLRVLNLSGNRIRHLSNIENLSALAELNLGRNFIASLMPPEEAAAGEVRRCLVLMRHKHWNRGVVLCQQHEMQQHDCPFLRVAVVLHVFAADTLCLHDAIGRNVSRRGGWLPLLSVQCGCSTVLAEAARTTCNI